MKKVTKLFGIIALIAIIGIGIAGCGGGTEPGKGEPVYRVEGVSLNQYDLYMNADDTGYLTATVSPYNATNKAVSWRSDNDSVASVSNNGSVNATVTAHSGGNVTITVTTVDGNFRSNCNVIVYPSNSPLNGAVSISGNAVVGQTLTANTGALGGSGTISYQWKRGTANIGMNSSAYTVQETDVGSAITVTVTRDGYSGSVTSDPVTVQGEEIFNINITITFAQITDAAPSITVPTLYRVSNGGPTSVTLRVDESEQYDSISWQVGNTSVTGTGESFTLSAANTAYNLIGEHFVTVMVMKDGAPFNKTVSFKIEY